MQRVERPVQIVVVHTETGLRSQVLEAIRCQGFEPTQLLTSARTPFGYGDILRGMWLWAWEWVLVEQDVVMCPGTLARLAECDQDWCTHPHWMGDHLGKETTGVVRFSLRLRRRLPDLMHQVCAWPDPRYWVRRGWTRIAHDCNPQTLNRAGRVATLKPGSPPKASTDSWGMRYTTHDWHGIDSDLAVRLHQHGVESHLHPEHTVHLHDYGTHPPGRYVPWWMRPYDPSEWEHGWSNKDQGLGIG